MVPFFLHILIVCLAGFKSTVAVELLPDLTNLYGLPPDQIVPERSSGIFYYISEGQPDLNGVVACIDGNSHVYFPHQAHHRGSKPLKRALSAYIVVKQVKSP